MPTFTSITKFLETWGVWFTGATFLYSGWRKTKASVTKWANTLVHNHAAHIQAAVEKQSDTLVRIENQQSQQIGLLQIIANKK